MLSAGTDNVGPKWDPQQSGIFDYAPCYTYSANNPLPNSSARSRVSEARIKWNNVGTEFLIWAAGSGCGKQITVQYHHMVVPMNEYWAVVTNDFFGDISNSTMTFNASPDNGQGGAYSWYFGTGTPGSSSGDFLSIALHEFGHTIQLNDLSYGTDVMKGSIAPGAMRRSLKTHDISSIKARYAMAQ